VTITSTAFSDVGTHGITVTLSDGLASPTFTFNIIITNTAPTFTTAPPSFLTLAMNAAASTYSFSDAESNPITLVVTDETNSGTPSYITFTSTSFSIRATSFSAIGTHTLTVTISDGQPLSTSKSIALTFTNSAPTFASAPVGQTVANNAILAYTLPASSDAEGNAFTITLTSTKTWVALSGNVLTFTNPPLSDVGTISMTLTLNDANKQ
jgi:large repetitive protein